MCNKYDTSLDLEGCSGDYIREESSSSKCIYGSNPKHHHMKWCIVEIVLVGDRDPGSKQWCTNSSEGARQVQGQGRVSERCYQGSYGEQNRRKPCNKMAKAIHESCSLSFHRPGRTAIVSKQVVERGEEATTSPVGLSYPKVKRRLERRWTQRSTTVL
ncbi:hypothetical protein BHE74_00006249 [Ensete ventricosum]|nr:hypothetical protein BHE74_00006249 [Ensete ventricosum]